MCASDDACHRKTTFAISSGRWSHEKSLMCGFNVIGIGTLSKNIIMGERRPPDVKISRRRERYTQYGYYIPGMKLYLRDQKRYLLRLYVIVKLGLFWTYPRSFVEIGWHTRMSVLWHFVHQFNLLLPISFSFLFDAKHRLDFVPKFQKTNNFFTF